VFLTPERKPFYAGTYFPLHPRYGQPGFQQVLGSLSAAWSKNRDQVLGQADKVVQHMQQLTMGSDQLPELGPEVQTPGLDLLDVAAEQLGQLFDPAHGGFGGPPKFPHADSIRIALRQHLATGDGHALHMATHTLDEMARGGIYDQLGGGFARYSTDGEWAIPHFEKMLYDNALLVPAYLEAYALTGNELFQRVARESCEWVLREMVDPAGGLWSTQDADSEGEEGKFFAWQRDEVLAVVGKQHAQLVDTCWGLGASQNFEGGSWVLLRPKPDAALAEALGMTVDAMHAALEPLRQKLFEVRDARVHPGTDDKVLVAWNGLMISALAQASVALDEPRFLHTAQRAADFCLTTMRPDGRRLLATSRGGKAHINGTLADYAYLAGGLLDLHHADGDLRWPTAALELAEVVQAHFADTERAGFFFTSDDHESLVARPRDLEDGAIPSSNAVMVEVLLRLAELTGDLGLRTAADRTLAMLEPAMRQAPSAFSRMLLALLRAAGGSRTVVIAEGPGADLLVEVVQDEADPLLSLVRVPASGPHAADAERFPLLAGKLAIDGQATAYLCRDGSCAAPATSPETLLTQLAGTG
jgi:uncharacterized protein YyaL (SSP411 family)